MSSAASEVLQNHRSGSVAATQSPPNSTPDLQAAAFMTVVRNRFNAAMSATHLSPPAVVGNIHNGRVPAVSQPENQQHRLSSPPSDRKSSGGFLAFSVAAIIGRNSPEPPEQPPTASTPRLNTVDAAQSPPPTSNTDRVRRRQQRRRYHREERRQNGCVTSDDDEIEPEVDVEREDIEDGAEFEGVRDDDDISVDDSYCGGVDDDESDLEDRLRSGADSSLERGSPSSSSPQSTSSGRPPLMPPQSMMFRGPPNHPPPFLPTNLQDLSAACKTWPHQLAMVAAQQFQQNPWFSAQFPHPPSKFTSAHIFVF